MTDRDTRSTAEADQGSASPRQRAIRAYEDARDQASETVGQAPLLVLAGGIAAGALIAALLPRTDAETRLVRPAADRVKGSAKAAIEAARETGTQQLQAAGISRDKGEETIRNLLGSLTDAAKASANAAVDAVRKQG